MKISYVKIAFLLVVTSLSTLNIAEEISPEQLAMLEKLPPDQRSNIMEKMSSATTLTGEIEEAFAGARFTSGLMI